MNRPQRFINKGRLWTNEDWAIYQRNKSEILVEMLVEDRYQATKPRANAPAIVAGLLEPYRSVAKCVAIAIGNRHRDFTALLRDTIY